MTSVQAADASPSASVWRSIGAVLAGIAVNVVLALIADQILHSLGVFPPWGQVTYEPVPFVIATAYRCVFGVLGAYVTARLAPRNPMRHALILGGLGVVMSGIGLAVSLARPLGPVWYAGVLVVVALPLAWLGGKLYERSRV